jgi:hypothetical protein
VLFDLVSKQRLIDKMNYNFLIDLMLKLIILNIFSPVFLVGSMLLIFLVFCVVL